MNTKTAVAPETRLVEACGLDPQDLKLPIKETTVTDAINRLKKLRDKKKDTK